MAKFLKARARVARGTFAALCVGVGVLSVSDAGWALRLRAQGYYADLQTYLYAPPEAFAGQTVGYFGHVFNNGPDAVDDVTLAVRVDGEVLMPGCEWVEQGAYTCRLDVPLPVYGYASFDLPVRIDPFHVGPAVIGVLATSALQDLVPHNSFHVGSTWVTRRYDVQVAVDPSGIWYTPQGRMLPVHVWHTGFSGASGLAATATYSGGQSGDASLECVEQVHAYCYGPSWITMYPGGHVQLALLLPDDAVGDAGYVVQVRVHTPDGEDTYTWNNQTLFHHSVSLFASGFE